MDWQQALALRLIEDGATSAIAADRWDWDEREQTTKLPCGVLRLVSDPRPQHLAGFVSRRESRVQVNCEATDRDTAIALREAAIAAVVPGGTFNGIGFGRGMIENVFGDAEPSESGRIFRQRFDLLVMHD
ncbi:hypothetical protein ACRAQ6_13950 [Erythrobacter sp. HA6-11]